MTINTLALSCCLAIAALGSGCTTKPLLEGQVVDITVFRPATPTVNGICKSYRAQTYTEDDNLSVKKYDGYLILCFPDGTKEYVPDGRYNERIVFR